MTNMSSTKTSCPQESIQCEENSGDEDENDEMLDPRVKIELESLNSATTEINDLEQELEEMHALFRQTLSESAFVLKTQSNILGKCVKSSRPYYEKMEHAKKLQLETQKAALNYERACSQHQAAKQAVAHAEQKLVSTSSEHKTLDHTWQEMLNKAIKKVMDSEVQKQQSEREHLHTAQKLTKANKEISDMKIKLKSSISKSRVYYDLRDKYMEVLEGHKQKILTIQQQLKNSKHSYSKSLRNLESISDEIHEMRKSQVDLTGPRQDGVGAECSETVHENIINSNDDMIPDGFEQADDEYGAKIDIDDEDINSVLNRSETDDIENDDSALQSKTSRDSNVKCTECNDSCEYGAIRNDVQKQDDVDHDDKTALIADQSVQDNVGIDIENGDSTLQNETTFHSNIIDIDEPNANDVDNVYSHDHPVQRELFTKQNDIVHECNTDNSSHSTDHDELDKEQLAINHKEKESKGNNNEREVKTDIVDFKDDGTDCKEQLDDPIYIEKLATDGINQIEAEMDETKQTTVDEAIDGVDSNEKLPECKTEEENEITNDQNDSDS